MRLEFSAVIQLNDVLSQLHCDNNFDVKFKASVIRLVYAPLRLQQQDSSVCSKGCTLSMLVDAC